MNMTQQRVKMVDNQLRPFDVFQYDVLSAFLTIPRDLFVPEKQRALAFSDAQIDVQDGDVTRMMLRPMHLARMVQAMGINKDSVILDVGCLTGYSSAILAQLAGSVVALEASESLAERATNALSDAGIDTVAVLSGPLATGCPSEAPFDAILLGGAVDEVPLELVSQLREDGVMIAVLGKGGAGRAVSIHRDGNHHTMVPLFNCAAPALPGFEREAAFSF